MQLEEFLMLCDAVPNFTPTCLILSPYTLLYVYVIFAKIIISSQFKPAG
jgi:hypothetical protein